MMSYDKSENYMNVLRDGPMSVTHVGFAVMISVLLQKFVRDRLNGCRIIAIFRFPIWRPSIWLEVAHSHPLLGEEGSGHIFPK